MANLFSGTLSSSSSATLRNDGTYTPVVQVIITAPNSPTGTNPTLDVSVDFSDDGINYPANTLRKFDQITTSLPNKTAIVFQLDFFEFMRVTWALGGTSSPQFTGVSIDAFGPTATHGIVLGQSLTTIPTKFRSE